MGAARPSRTRARVRVIGAAVVVLGGVAALGFGLAANKRAPTAAATTMTAPSSDPPALPSAAAPTAAAPSLAASLAEPVASASAPIVASAQITTQRPAPPVRRPVVGAAPAASVTEAAVAAPPAPSASAAPPTPESPKPPLGFAKSRKD
jgi:hypothetical protein